MMPPLSRPSRYPWSHLFLCSKSPAALRPPALIKKQTEPLSRPAGVLLRMVRDGAQVAHCLVQRHKTKPPTCSEISGKAATQWELVHYSTLITPRAPSYRYVPCRGCLTKPSLINFNPFEAYLHISCAQWSILTRYDCCHIGQL